MEARDWQLIKPHLQENERIFGITITRLLDGREPYEVYRKIKPRTVWALQAEEDCVHRGN